MDKRIGSSRISYGRVTELSDFSLLSALRDGECATVTSVAGSSLGSKRLADIGFFQGAEVTMLRTGKPCIVKVGRSRVAVGGGYQGMIGVSLTEADSRPVSSR
jgi:Fe2+ transport system protein FeoA